MSELLVAKERATKTDDKFTLVLANFSSEAADRATARKRLDWTDERGVASLKLGRYPFEAARRLFLESRRGIVSEGTRKEEGRKLKYLGGVLDGLVKEGRIASTDPRHLVRHEIQELLVWMRARNLDPATQTKYLQYLHNLLKYFKNYVIEEMKAEGVRFPREPRKPIVTISVSDLRTIFTALDRMKRWNGAVARGMIALYFATGLRPSELRLAHVEDLDIVRMKLYVRFPKGAGKWAGPCWVDIIRPDMVPQIVRYLKERQQHLERLGLTEEKALFPAVGSRGRGFYSSQGFNKIKRRIENASGVRFCLKDLRPTLTSITVNGDLSLLPAMSVQLRHASVKMTQDHYARIEEGVAGRKLAEAWKNTPILTAQTPVIGEKYGASGYA